ncbi:response regulator transcription factor [Roseibacterium beibuensis]|uniref:LuxR C-terminal-related transcriptional regulator n=1 Tax=[Roseibacterium] beibuensis TaxID=1193142 RepID=UPI00217E2BF6|nr:response regulator transcription factor [Roseibacterium beibuensis]MCS6622531.1 response regulator transcription factor [Roseibacterium beibuensis]
MTEFREGILVADGHTLARGGMVSILLTDLSQRDVTSVSEFEGVTATLSSHAGLRLLLLDSGLPGLGGIEGLRRIRLQCPDIRVVLMAAQVSRADAFEALAAGAHGYLPKDLPPEDLAHAIRMVLDGQIYVPTIISDLSLGESGAPGESERDSVELTVRQREVLNHLAAGLSNKEIARALNIAEGTVKVHVTAAFRVLHVHNRVGAAAALLKLGPSDRRAQPDLPGLAEQDFPPPRKRDLGAKVVLACLPLWVEAPWMNALESLI